LSREKLAALERLQVIDLQIEELTKQADAFPARLVDLEKEATKARALADAERGRLADNERARAHAENSLKEEQEKVKKWESRLPQLKHQREFAALQREIDSANKANEFTEASLVDLKAAAEPLRASVQQKEAELKVREAALAKESAGLQKNEEALRKQAATLKEQRDQARAAVDPKLGGVYEQVRKRKGGRVVVVMNNNGTCSGCHRKQLPQLANQVMGGAIEPCPACGRLMFTLPPPPDHHQL